MPRNNWDPPWKISYVLDIAFKEGSHRVVSYFPWPTYTVCISIGTWNVLWIVTCLLYKCAGPKWGNTSSLTWTWCNQVKSADYPQSVHRHKTGSANRRYNNHFYKNRWPFVVLPGLALSKISAWMCFWALPLSSVASGAYFRASVGLAQDTHLRSQYYHHFHSKFVLLWYLRHQCIVGSPCKCQWREYRQGRGRTSFMSRI